MIKQGTWCSMQSHSWRALQRRRDCEQSEKNSFIFEWKTLRKLWKALMSGKKTVQFIFDIRINYLCLSMFGTRWWFSLTYVLEVVQGPESQDSMTQDYLWLKDSFIQVGKMWGILESVIDFLCPVFRWQAFGWHRHTHTAEFPVPALVSFPGSHLQVT